MSRHRGTLVLPLLVALIASCIWPFPETTAHPAAPASATPRRVVPTDGVYLSPVAVPRTGSREHEIAVSPTAVVVLGRGGLFSGRTIRFDLPEGYRALEGADGGCFLYHESLPGFLVLYPAPGEPADTLAGLLNATANTRRSEPPLEVDLGRVTFVGLFVETRADDRLFLAATDGWALVAQGPVGDWPALAAGLNRVLVSLSFEEVE